MAEFKGFNSSVSDGDNSSQFLKNSFDCGVFSLSCGRIGEAYLCFISSDQKNIAVLYNIALCFYISKSYEKALSYLDNAFRFLSDLPDRIVTVPEELEMYEAQNDGYKSAMMSYIPKLYPERCRISMLRLKADLLFAMGNIQELEKILPAMSGRNYKNIENIKGMINKEE